MTERYSIGKVSTACNIPIKTLRYYDEIDLLKPEYRDNDSNYRYYSKDQMTTILCIRRLRSLGFCLKDIKELISRSDLATIEEKVNYRCQTIIEEIDLLNAKMEACQSLLHRVSTGSEIVQQHDKQNPNSNVQVKIEEIPATTMFSTRKVMKQYRSTDVSLDRWQTLYDMCDEYGIHSSSPVILTYHAKTLDQFLMNDCDVEFGILTDHRTALRSRQSPIADMFRSWGGFTAATAHHLGDYEEIIKTHIAILQWSHQHGYEVVGPTSEEYIVSPLDVTNNAARVTKIIMPVKKV